MDMAAIIEEGQRRAAAVVERALAQMGPAVPKQEQMRREFEVAIQEQGGLEAFQGQYGEEEAMRQALLALKRREREQA